MIPDFPILRRSWLAASLSSLARAATTETQTFHHQNVLGTSLEMQTLGPGGAAAFDAALVEIERLRRIFSTYDPDSEIRRWQASQERLRPHPELATLLALYSSWQQRTGGAIASVLAGRRDTNALGKSYILDRAIHAAHRAAPGSHALLLNIGGDIAMRNGPWRIGVTSPFAWHDNALPLTELQLTSCAIATSGGYERGARHLIDPRTGQPANGAAAATVFAPDAVTANALSTALCVLDPGQARALVESTPEAEAILTARDGTLWRSAGFANTELPAARRLVAASAWPNNHQLTITLTLKSIEGYRVRRPYVAVWAEDESGKVVRNITVWTERRRWLPDLFDWWKKSGSTGGGSSVTRATRPPGRYQLLWDGLNDQGQPVGQGAFRIVVESNREHGSYAKESGVISCGANPAQLKLKENPEFAVELNYGPGAQQA